MMEAYLDVLKANIGRIEEYRNVGDKNHAKAETKVFKVALHHLRDYIPDADFRMMYCRLLDYAIEFDVTV